MKKRLAPFYAIPLLLFILSGTIFYCKKTVTPSNNEIQADDLITYNRVISWLEQEQINLKDTGNKKNIETIKSAIASDRIQREYLSPGKQLLVVQLKDDFKTNNVTSQKTSKNLVFIETENKKLKMGRIIEIIPGQPGEIPPQNLISSALNQHNTSYNGVISIMTISNRLFAEIDYKAGNVKGVRVIRTKSKNLLPATPLSGNRVQVGCTDWYWEYYLDGMLVGEEYAYTTCAGTTGDAPCEAYRIFNKNAANFKVDCSGGGGDADGNDYDEQSATTRSDDNHVSCRSFKFARGGLTDAQEAGILNINFEVASVDGSSKIKRVLPHPFYVTVPLIKSNSYEVSPEEAAARTADALDAAGISLIKKYKDLGYTVEQFSAVSDNQLEAELRNLWIGQLMNQFPNSGAINVKIQTPAFSTTVANKAIINSSWEIISNKLTGSGCW